MTKQVGYWKGKKLSEKHKRKIGEACKGKPAWNKGKHFVSEGSFKKGDIPWNKGLSFSGMTGKNQTDYQKKRVSDFMFEWWSNHPNQREENRKRVYKMLTDKNPNICLSLKCEREFQSIRKRILKHDENICQHCGKKGNTVHHIDYDKSNNNPSNLITFCLSCNSKVNKNRELWKNFLSHVKKSFVLGRIYTKENMDMNSLEVRTKCGY